MKGSNVVSFLTLSFILALSATALGQPHTPGAVYVASNAADGNAVLVFARSPWGKLTPVGSFPTGGKGTGAGLGNQGGVILSADQKWLLVVNAGSDEISAFEVRANGLSLTDKVPSGGKRPISLTLHRDILYVLNAGGAAGAEDNITAFTVSRRGKLTLIASSTRLLSASNTGPAQINFNPRGDLLIVTEKNTNNIDLFTVDRSGLATGPAVHPSAGATPFGFAFGKRDQLFVSEAFGGAADASALSSYQIGPNNALRVISPSVPTTETAACWTVVTNDGRFAYVTNTGSGTISGYSVRFGAGLKLLEPDGQSALTGAGPIDAALSTNDLFLYTLNSAAQTITGFLVGDEGSLTPVTTVGGLPSAANGMAAR
jgi:6-phosphogluconolactonase